MPLNWKTGGLLLGVVFFAAILLAKPVGVSTQFVTLAGIVWDMVDPAIVVEDATAKSGYASPNAYLNASGGSLAKSIAQPLNYGLLFLAAMFVGALGSRLMRAGDGPGEGTMPAVWRANFGDSAATRYLAAFIAGFIVLFGARLAGGCTSGHMMSGIMQTAVSGYLFTAGAFLAGIPVALALFKKEG